MKDVVRLTVLVALGIGLSTQAAAAGQQQLSQQLKAECPGAAAWFDDGDNGLSSEQVHKLESIRPTDPALAAQLAQRYARDQAAEHAMINAHVPRESQAAAMKSASWKHLLAIQKANLDWFKPIVDAQGFPTVQQVGLHGVEHAWMLVQHADVDPAFQAKVLAELKPRLSAEPFLKNDYALLFDRVNIAQRKKQVYGTQFTSKDGRLVMQPTADVEQLNARRASMNLMPISDYRCFMGVLYHMHANSGARSSASAGK